MDRRWVLGGVLIAGGVGVVRVVTYRPKFTEDSKILIIGDSLANGMAPHFRGLADEEGLPLLAGAVNGTRVDQWKQSRWLLQKLQEFQPTHVLISLGTNDAYTSKTPEEVANSTDTLLDVIEAHNAHPIWIGAPALPESSAGAPLNEGILDEIRGVVPYYFDSTTLEIPRGPDALHPSAAGYAGWAGFIWNWLT